MRRGLLTIALTAAALGAAAGPAQAITPTIVNSGNTNGPQWLESQATAGDSENNSANKLRVTVVVKHDPGKSVTGLRIDENWNTTDDTAGAGIKTVTSQQPTIQGGYGYSRVSYEWSLSTSGTGFDCPIVGGASRRTTKPLKLRARLNDGTETASVSGDVFFVATGNCSAREDWAYVYGWGDASHPVRQEVTPGSTATFVLKGDDVDSGTDEDFNGAHVRIRRLSDGAVVDKGEFCDQPGDHTTKSFPITFADRGLWVVEGELLNNCSDNDGDNPGKWFYIGTADVNSSASASPEVSLTGVPARPTINQTFTAAATVNDTEDAGDGGLVQDIEWDLDYNTSNGVGGFEVADLGDHATGLTSAQRQRSINTTGLTAGQTYTVRARVTDNGAINGADSSRRQKIATASFKVDTPPVAAAQTKETDAGNAVNVTLTGTDADSDSLTYSVTQPANGTVTGSGTNRTYTPNAGYAGTDSFTYTVNDGFGGTDTKTITVKVYPRTTLNAFPPADSNNNDPSFEFSSQSGTSFQCKLDTGAFGACSSPKAYTDVAEGDHTFTVKATAGALEERAPVVHNFNVDTIAPATTFGAGLPTDPTNSRNAHFEWTAADANTVTFECSVDGGAFDDCTSPVNLTNVQDGGHSFEVRGTDEAGNVESPAAYYEWNVDATPPDTQFDVTPERSTRLSDADFQWDSDDDDATYECKLDLGNWETCDPQNEAHLTGLAEGNHTFSVRGTDLLGNVETDFATYAWEVDTSAPETTIDDAPEDPTNDADGDFEFSSNDNDPVAGTFECQVDGNGWDDCDSGVYNTGDLADGDHTFEVRATDAAGNVDTTPASHTWEVDTTAPQTHIEVAPNARTTSTSATFAWSSTEPDGATFECRVDGETLAPCAGTERTITGLADGNHTFEVVATDDAGNTDPTSATHTWEVDTTAPSTDLTEAPGPFSSSTDATFEWESDDPSASYECRVDNSLWTDCSSPYELTNLSENAHLFEVRGVDELGNTETTPEAHLWVIDQSPPDTSIDTYPEDPTNATSASFEVTSPDQPFITTIECRLDGGAWDDCEQPTSGLAPWTVSYSGLTDGQHTFEARVIDRAGQTDATPATYTWTVDTDPPAVSFTDTPDDFTQDTDAHFEYTSDEAGTSYECQLDGGGFGPCGSTSELTGLSEDEHSFDVRGTDPAGNVSPVVTHDWEIDRAAPTTTIDDGPDAITNENEATFDFSSNETGSTFECKLDTDADYAPCESGDTFTGIADGDRTFSAVAIDRAGNKDGSPATYTWNIDHTPPTVQWTDFEDNPTKNRDPSFSFEANESGSTFECELDNGGWNSCTSPFTASGLADGQHQIRVRATDPRHNVSDVYSRIWFIDNAAPTTTITTEPSGDKLNQRTFEFAFASSEPESTFECVLDGAAAVDCNSGSFEATDLADGSHTFTVTATDKAGNEDATGDTSSFTVDATAPETDLEDNIGPVEGSYLSTSSATFEFTGSDNDGTPTFECSLDGSAFVACTSPHAESGLADQEHTFEVRAKDAHGNVDPTPEKRTWIVDTTDPSVNFSSGPSLNSDDATPTFEWTGSNDVATFECSFDSGTYEECESPKELTVNDGPHTLHVRATDHAGNTDTTGYSWTTDTVDPDTTLNPVSGTPAEGLTVTVTSADFEFTSNETPENFDCKLDTGAWTDCDSPQNLTGLPEGDHTFSVRAKDQAGNVDEDPVVRHWTVDTVGPEVSFTTKPSDPSNDETPAFEWTSEDEATFECKLDDAAAFSDCDSGDEFPVDEDDHTLLVHATDTNGNVGPDASYEWTVDLTDPDTELTNGPQENGTYASRDASFEFTGTGAPAKLECKLDDGDWADCASPKALTVPTDGEHTFTVRAVDAAGNADPTPESRTWIADTTAPTTDVTSNRTGATSETDVEIIFNASDSQGYECKFDDEDWETDCHSPYTRSGLADGDHVFQVRATDAVGNQENPPAKAEWRVDTAAPDTVIDSGPADGSTVASDSATFGFSADRADDGDTFECQLDSEPAEACDSGSVTYSDLSDEEHTFTVTATDAAGNTDSSSATRSWTVDTTGPEVTFTETPQDPSKSDSPAFNWTSEAGATFECKLDTDAAFAGCNPGNVDVDEGDRKFEVRAKDTLGNVGPAKAYEWTVDLTAPTASIDDQPDDPTNATGAAFDFSSNEPAGAEFDCKLDSGAVEACDSGSKSYSGLTDGDHTFTVTTTDAAGNTSADATYTWEIDTDTPGVTIDAGPNGVVSSDVAHFEYTVDDNTAAIECKLDDEAFGACDSRTAHDEEDLTDAEHTFVVKVTDAAGNSDDATRTWTVDTTGPQTTIDSAPADASTSTSAEFTFSSEAGATFECKLDAGDFGACASPKSYTDLATGNHTFQVRAKDAVGNVDATPAEKTWTIASTPIDTNPNGQNPDGQNPGGGNGPVGPGTGPSGPGETPVCRFSAPGPGCGPAALTAKLSPKKAGAPVDLTLTGDGKGVQLKTVTFTLPRGLTLTAVKKARGKTIGSLTYTTLPTHGAIAPSKLTLPKKPKKTSTVLSAGKTKVTVKFGKAGKVTLTGLPEGVTKVKLVLKGKRTGLATTAKKCGALNYGAAFVDQSNGKASAKATDTTCKKQRGSRR